MNFVAPEPTQEELLVSSIQQGKVDGIDSWMSTRGLDALEAVKVGESEMNVLHVSCFYGNMPAVLKLLEYFPFDKPTKGGNTPCHLAAMNGHSSIVDILLERGASPGAKNLKGQNVFDVAQGLQLRQTLMTLVLAEEQRNGTAPVISGVTRDMTKDQERLRNLPPPPTSFGAPPTGGGGPTPPPSSNTPPPNAYMQTAARPPLTQTIQPDGFVTTVGRPDLAAKYGNQTQTRLVAESANGPQAVQQQWIPPTRTTAAPVNASARYVVNTPGFTVVNSAPRPNPPMNAFKPPIAAVAGKVNVFNPAAFANQQDQQSVGQQSNQAPFGQQPQAMSPSAFGQQPQAMSPGASGQVYQQQQYAQQTQYPQQLPYQQQQPPMFAPQQQQYPPQ